MESPSNPSTSLLCSLLLSSLLLLFHIPHSQSFNSNKQPKCREEERNALLEFKSTHTPYHIFDPERAANLTTWTGEDCCNNWDGVECDNYTGYVIGLDLGYSCLSGFINSSTTIFKLTHLQMLDLSYNCFNDSKIPSAIGNLSRLERLDIIDLTFWGQIPSEILNLTNLSDLYINNRRLELKKPSLWDLVQSLVKLEFLGLPFVQIPSPIPDSLSRLTSLRSLILYNCNLQGQVPPSLSNLTKLETIDLSDNLLTGEIFPQLVRLTKLQELDLSYNNFSGQIPRTISHLKNLTSLHLASNNFNGEIHLDSFFQLDRLGELDLSSNNFSLVIDSSTKPTSKLLRLNLSFNDISGNIPTGICNLDSLTELSLRNTNLVGMIPQCLIGMDGAQRLVHLDLSYNHLSGFEANFPLLKWSLRYLDLRFNHLKGSLPIPSVNSSLNYYLVSNNQFYEELPTKVCDLINLYIFDIGNNSLSGMIPQCLSKLIGIGNLSVLNLHNNNFDGPIPRVGKNRCNLMMIDMSYNQLEGPVPRDMKYCRYLEFLNLGNNKISDDFPSWLGNTNLSVLILRSNRFRGIIEKPSSGYEFPKLQIINLSYNNFTGCLPSQYFEGWRAMKVDAHEEDRTTSYAAYRNGDYFYTVTMTNKRLEIEYTKIPQSLAGIDLSSNHFTGEIPTSIATLKVLCFLNLSNNIFAGSILFNLNGLTNLESLDLSHNKLSGKIPQQLTDLTALEVFDVSFNQLTGPIPQSNQFNTFENSSYQGNLDLCGLPLSRKCGNVIDSSPPPPLEEDHWIEIDWKIVSMGYTSGFVIGVVMGMHWTRGCKRMKRIRQIKFILT